MLLATFKANALNFKSNWNFKFEKELIISCNEDEYYCDDLCLNQKVCVIKEKLCRDCLGSTPYMTHIFNQIGKSIVSTEEDVLMEDVFDFIKGENFATLTSRSVYNSVDRFNSELMQEKFRSLCVSGDVESPMMIFATQEVSNLLAKGLYVICNEKAYRVDMMGGTKLAGGNDHFN
jgi:hypothetical protein